MVIENNVGWCFSSFASLCRNQDTLLTVLSLFVSCLALNICLFFVSKCLLFKDLIKLFKKSHVPPSYFLHLKSGQPHARITGKEKPKDRSQERLGSQQHRDITHQAPFTLVFTSSQVCFTPYRKATMVYVHSRQLLSARCPFGPKHNVVQARSARCSRLHHPSM